MEYVPPPVVYHLPADITTSTQQPHPTSRTSGSMTRNAAYNYSSSSSLRDDARDGTFYTMNQAYRRVSPVNISPGRSQSHHHPPHMLPNVCDVEVDMQLPMHGSVLYIYTSWLLFYRLSTLSGTTFHLHVLTFEQHKLSYW